MLKMVLLATLLIATIFCLSPSLSTGAEKPGATAAGQLEPSTATKEPSSQPVQTPRDLKAKEGKKADEAKQTEEAKKLTNYSNEAVLLVVLVLALLAGIFFLLMNWSQRSDRLSYLGKLYQETIEDIEYKRLTAGPSEKLKSGDYHREIAMDGTWMASNQRPSPPDGLPYQPSYVPPGLPGLGGSRRPTGYTTLDDTVTDPAQLKKQRELQNKWNIDLDNWERKLDAEAQRRYRADLDTARQKAKEQAGLAIDVDLAALHGKGAEFVLEFTTVVVIIFAAVILGILKILDTQQLGTLLAAIAGYVLGRATQRARNEPVRSGESEKAKETKGEGSERPLASPKV